MTNTDKLIAADYIIKQAWMQAARMASRGVMNFVGTRGKGMLIGGGLGLGVHSVLDGFKQRFQQPQNSNPPLSFKPNIDGGGTSQFMMNAKPRFTVPATHTQPKPTPGWSPSSRRAALSPGQEEFLRQNPLRAGGYALMGYRNVPEATPAQ